MSQPQTDRSSPPVKPKSGCGRTILKGLLVLIVVIAAAGIFLWQRNEAIRRAAREESILQNLEQPKNLALKAVQANDDVKADLGDTIAEKGSQGNLRREGTGELDRSNARFSFDVAGAKAAAVVDAVAKQADGNWRINQIKVKLGSGKTIDVPPPSDDAPPELDFNP